MLVSSMKSSLVIDLRQARTSPNAEIDLSPSRPLASSSRDKKLVEPHCPVHLLGKLTRRAPSGQADELRPPIDQNRSKLQFFRDQLPPIWPVQGAGIFTSAKAVPHPTLLVDPLGRADLPRSLRIRRNAFAGANPIGVELARTTVLLFADNSRTGLYKHKTAVASME